MKRRSCSALKEAEEERSARAKRRAVNRKRYAFRSAIAREIHPRIRASASISKSREAHSEEQQLPPFVTFRSRDSHIESSGQVDRETQKRAIRYPLLPRFALKSLSVTRYLVLRGKSCFSLSDPPRVTYNVYS